MALPPALAPAPHPSQNTAQVPLLEQNPRESHFAAVDSPASSRDFDQSAMQRSSPSSPPDHTSLNSIDPAFGGSGIMSTSNESGGDDNGSDGRKGYGKRELSTSKRAAQNRAAQRAFRQRKEGYIKKLEEQVRDYTLLNENYKAVQVENYQLRDYIINLQSRLIESQGDFPQPPPNVDIPHPNRRQKSDRHEPQTGAPSRSSNVDISALNQLRASAVQAGQDLGTGSPSKHLNEDSYGPESHLAKRIKNDGAPVDPATAAQEALQGGVLNRKSRDGETLRQLLST